MVLLFLLSLWDEWLIFLGSFELNVWLAWLNCYLYELMGLVWLKLLPVVWLKLLDCERFKVLASLFYSIWVLKISFILFGLNK